MIVALIIACEVGFWVLLALGLSVRYLLKWRRTSVVLLLCEPVLELVLFVATAIDLKNGAEPGWEHGLAAIYIGYTVAYGHYTIRWLDGHAAHRLAGAPRPPKPPQYGMARARHEEACGCGRCSPRRWPVRSSRARSGTSGTVTPRPCGPSSGWHCAPPASTAWSRWPT